MCDEGTKIQKCINSEMVVCIRQTIIKLDWHQAPIFKNSSDNITGFYKTLGHSKLSCKCKIKKKKKKRET